MMKEIYASTKGTYLNKFCHILVIILNHHQILNKTQIKICPIYIVVNVQKTEERSEIKQIKIIADLF